MRARKRTGCGRSAALCFVSIFVMACGNSESVNTSATKANQPTASGVEPATRWTDSKGFFSIVPPAGWQRQEYPDDPRGRVRFGAPGQDGSLMVMAKAVTTPGYDSLVRELKETEKTLGLDTAIEPVVFKGMPAIRRQATVTRQGVTVKMLWIDLLIDGVSHNLQYSASPSNFDRFSGEAVASMETYQPVPRAGAATGDAARSHEVAKWLNLARLAVDMNKAQAAKDAIEAGLRLDPGNADLLQLKETLVSR